MGCSFRPKPSTPLADLKMTWLRFPPDSGSLVYRMDKGKELLDSQDPDYKGRVKLLTEELENGLAKIQVSRCRDMFRFTLYQYVMGHFNCISPFSSVTFSGLSSRPFSGLHRMMFQQYQILCSLNARVSVFIYAHIIVSKHRKGTTVLLKMKQILDKVMSQESHPKFRTFISQQLSLYRSRHFLCDMVPCRDYTTKFSTLTFNMIHTVTSSNSFLCVLLLCRSPDSGSKTLGCTSAWCRHQKELITKQ